MSAAVIEATGLGKRYRIGTRVPYKTLREAIAGIASAAARRRRREVTTEEGTLWALRDVSFRVEPGEALGIIGRNGAGKTTLLKILSRITEPSTGEVRLRGRVGSLLEVGTGFHPELTGRENIFLNGAILGMRTAEVKRKFDEIVAFAEVERFLDTPVKHYSSGMYVRLAFAVAAHLEPEILLIDEVLAVGDAAFQRKCLGKMEDVAGEGRTVLFVSHNLGLVRQLCRRAILLVDGAVAADGVPADVVAAYLASAAVAGAGSVDLTDHPRRLRGMKRLLTRVNLADAGHGAATEFSQLDDIVLSLDYGTGGAVRLAGAGFIVYTDEGIRVGGGNTYMIQPPPFGIPPRGRVTFRIPARQFTPGAYLLTVSLGSHPGVLEDKIEHAIRFSVGPADIYGTGYLLTRQDGVMSLSFTAAATAVPT